MIVSKFPALVYVRRTFVGSTDPQIWHVQQWRLEGEAPQDKNVVKWYPISEEEAGQPVHELAAKYPPPEVQGLTA